MHLSSINLLFSKFFETKHFCENLLQEDLDLTVKGVLHNNLALAYFFGSDKYTKEKILDNLKQSLLFFE